MASILDPVQIGSVTLKNRVVFPSMCVFFCDAEGCINDTMTEYIRERAEGGVGLIIVPGSPHGKPGPGRPALSHNGYIPGWARLAQVVHRYGAKLFCQLHPAKFQAGRGEAIEDINDFTPQYIRSIIQSYADCALRARQAGVDGVEIHGAHAHEVAQFMSPFYNRRTDDYGGSTINRARFAAEIIRGIKATAGADYPLIFRISGDELVEGGRRVDETAEIARLLEEAGADAIHVSCGMPESEYAISAPMDVEDLFNVDSAARVKAAVSVPVIAVDRITTMEQADAVVQSGKADLAAMARANLADPELVAKYEGRVPGPVRRCVGCNQGCRDAVAYKKIRCMQNPRLGFEATLTLPPATGEEAGRSILIAGAGPAGLEAAYQLARRGFRPVVYEREAAPGGLMKLAALPPKKERMAEIIRFRVEALKAAGIEIRCGVEVTPELVAKEAPDVLIVATGSVPALPPVAGLDGEAVVTADDLLAGRRRLSGRVLVLGGGLTGCEAADHLAASGCRVELLEMGDRLAGGLNKSRRRFLLQRLAQSGVTVRLLTRAEAVEQDGVRVCSGDYRYTIAGIDGVVVATGRAPLDRLSQRVRELSPKTRVLVIGDAERPGLAIDAICQGARAAARV